MKAKVAAARSDRPEAQGRLARRLLAGLLPLVLSPVLLAAPFLFWLAEQDITDQITAQLNALSITKAEEIEQWATARKADIHNLAGSPDVVAAAQAFVLEPSGPAMAAGGDALLRRLERFVTNNPDYEALLVVQARTGEVLLSTSAYRQLIGQTPLDDSLLTASRLEPQMAPIRHYPQIAPEWIRLVVAAPVVDAQLGPIAVVVGIIPADRLTALAEPNPELGNVGRAYVIAGDGYLLTDPIRADTPRPQSDAIRQALVERRDGSGIYVDQFGEYVVGVYNWMPGFDMALMVEKNENEAFASLTRFSEIFVVILAAAALVGAAGMLLFTRRLVRPIQQLTESARRMAAGDLATRVPVTSRDEIGELAEAFSSMGGQLQTTLDTLEQRVADRTLELAQASEEMRYRAAQLQTVAEAAHAVASEQDLEKLLPLVTELISERFRFYHVGVFLLDEAGEYAVLQAANSDGGRRMLDRGHKLRVGQTGIVGYVTNRGEPRIALDVGLDAVYFDNPDLPLTRSEMAVPLKVRDRVIGAIDVQSQQPAAFTEQDAGLLTILADQVAIAIENVRLFAATRLALAEVQSVHRQYLRQEWSRLAAARGPLEAGYRYTGDGAVRPLEAPADLPEAAQALATGQVVVVADGAPANGQPAAGGQAALAVPIKLRDQVIGVVDLHRAGGAPWTDDDLALVQAVSDQVALALENARLFEETMRLAQRERTVAEITDRIYSASDARSVLRIAAEELRRITGSARAVVRVTRGAAEQATEVRD